MPFWRLYYHLVWATQERLPLITREVEKELYNYLALKAGGLGGIVLAIGGTLDHIHLATTIPPQIGVSKFVGQLKGASSFYMKRIPTETNLFWQRGYGAVSFGYRQMDQVIAYVRKQKGHHKAQELIPALERVEENDFGPAPPRY